MLKKLVIAGLGTVGLAMFVTHTSLGSYISTAYRRTASSAKDAVPMEFQIDRARNMVHDLEPEIRRSMHVIAKEEVEVASLDERVTTAEKNAEKDKTEILKLQSDLDTGHHTFQYAGHSYTSTEVKSDLSRRFVRFKTADATLDSMRQMHDARSRNLEAARQKLTAMMSAQRQLQVEVENLEAKHKLVQVAEASSDFQFDDSQLARCKELMTDIRTRLDVAAKLANADTNFHDEIPLDEAESEDVSKQVAEYFGLEHAQDGSGGDVEVATASYSH
jgi:predicted  nucleic acid-binding Zn-ribbon protein